jgi:hypothetical protein
MTGLTLPVLLGASMHLLQGHQKEASELLAALDGTGMHPAQVLEWMNRTDSSHQRVVLLAGTPKALAALQASDDAAKPQLAQAAAQTLQQLAQRNAQLGSQTKLAIASKTADALNTKTPSSTAVLDAFRSELLLPSLDRAQATVKKAQRADSPLAEPLRVALQAEQNLRQKGRAEGAYSQSWLGPASEHREPTGDELKAVAGMLAQRGTPSDYIKTWQRSVWFQIRSAAKQAWAALPQEAKVGRESGKFLSTDAYVGYLTQHAAAFHQIVGKRLHTRIRYDTLSASANNGGVLRTPQLQAIANEPDPEQRQALAAMATQTFQNKLARAWALPLAQQSTPRFSEFAQFANSPSGRDLFASTSGEKLSAQRSLMEATAMDLSVQIDAILQSPKAAPSQKADLKRTLVQQIAASPPGLADHAVARLKDRLAALNRA